ncbi:MAG: HD domain-containing protein [Clostridia bacterium]|nr:HD domain-containing protein [Clostridia bacterium]
MAADIKMDSIITDEAEFIMKMSSLFFGVSILVVAIILELVKSGMVFPLNSMASAASSFAYDSEAGRSLSLDKIDELDIHSGDEIENLYSALAKMAHDSSRYIDEVKQQNDQITKMQEEIILDFAEMVEARDKCTGDHIKKTSKYVKAIAEELRRDSVYSDVMTDEYINSLVRSAPLHDVGKIKISDLILNKPGRLTDEEFELMKTHTTEGRNILCNASSLANSSGYLKEAVDMANYHHERWDGTGYPTGLAGEDIPLSARIMAVADVFDALISRRSYKAPFSYEKATGIIREESGSHFDPVVVDAFLKISKELYEEDYGPVEGEESKDQGENK